MKQVSILLLALLFVAFIPPLDVPPPVPGEPPPQQAPPPPPPAPPNEVAPPLQEESSSIFLITALLFVFLALASGAGYYFFVQKQRAPELDKRRLTAIQAYVAQLRMQGIDDASIRAQLGQAGWPQDYINAVTKP